MTPEDRDAVRNILKVCELVIVVKGEKKTGLDPKMIGELIDSAVAEEREACARIAEAEEPPEFDEHSGRVWPRQLSPRGIAAAIRGRSDNVRQ